MYGFDYLSIRYTQCWSSQSLFTWEMTLPYCIIFFISRDNFMYAPSQWEMVLHRLALAECTHRNISSAYLRASEVRVPVDFIYQH